MIQDAVQPVASATIVAVPASGTPTRVQSVGAPTPAPPPSSTPSLSTTTPRPTGALDVLAEELGVLDRARTALHHGDAVGALAELDQHDSQYPAGALAPEALALRIESEERRGNVARVRTLVALFAMRYPSHPYLSRLKVLAEPKPSRP